MFGYITVPSSPPPPKQPPFPVAEKPPAKKRSKTNETVALLYSLLCLASIVAVLFTGYDVHIPSIPRADEEE